MPQSNLRLLLNKIVLILKILHCYRQFSVKLIVFIQVKLFNNIVFINIIALKENFYLKYKINIKFLSEINYLTIDKAIK